MACSSRKTPQSFSNRTGVNQVTKLSVLRRLELFLQSEPLAISQSKDETAVHEGEVFAGVQSVLLFFNWKSLSVAAGLTLWNFYFRIYAGAIKKEQVVDFLAALVRHLGQQLLIVWDRLPGHRSRLVQEYIAGLQGWISTAYLPPYAPELNPVEYIWGYWKQNELPNVCPKTTGNSAKQHDPGSMDEQPEPCKRLRRTDQRFSPI